MTSTDRPSARGPDGRGTMGAALLMWRGSGTALRCPPCARNGGSHACLLPSVCICGFHHPRGSDIEDEIEVDGSELAASSLPLPSWLVACSLRLEAPCLLLLSWLEARGSWLVARSFFLARRLQLAASSLLLLDIPPPPAHNGIHTEGDHPMTPAQHPEPAAAALAPSPPAMTPPLQRLTTVPSELPIRPFAAPRDR